LKTNLSTNSVAGLSKLTKTASQFDPVKREENGQKQ